ncbi:MAG TPA: helix-hairpin-helix domain-containing protein, partial [Flavisolibacter sp.]|nr:helix-hairpin-helix domain-containing protein [Flavisolibacter sp.]
MDNYAIADQLSLLSKLMDIHGENAFKSKSYSSAAFSLEKLPQQVATLSPDKIFKIKGIGESVGGKIIEIIETGELQQLKEYLAKTPPGVLEMMNIKGLGPKKINVLWKEMSIDTIEELKKACEENRVAGKKGFGEKTQQNILESIRFQQQNSGKYLYAKIESFAEAFTEKLKEKFTNYKFELTGSYRRQLEIIDSLDWVTTAPADELETYLTGIDMQLVANRDNMLIVTAENTLLLRFYTTSFSGFYSTLFRTSSGEKFLEAWKEDLDNQHFTSEEDIFKNAGINYIPSFLREQKEVIKKAGTYNFNNLVQTSDIKGLIHSHSNWSDGAYTLDEMAQELI